LRRSGEFTTKAVTARPVQRLDGQGTRAPFAVVVFLAVDVLQRPPVAIALDQAVDTRGDSLMGHLVKMDVRRRINLQPQIVYRFLAETVFQQGPYLLSIVATILDPFGPERFELDGLPESGLFLLLADEPHFGHAPEHIGLALLGPLRVEIRVIAAGGLGDTRQDGRLGQVQVFHVLGKVFLGRGFYPIGPMTQKDMVQVDVEDIFLGHIIVDAVSQHRFPDLSGEALLGGEQDALHHLLGNGAAALDHFTGLQVAEKGPDNTGDVHAGMIEEAGVFRGHKGQDQVPGQAAIGHFDPALRVELADTLAIPSIDLGDHRWPEFFNGGKIREVLQEMMVDKHPACSRHQYPGEHQAVNDHVQSPGPAPPLMIFFQPVGAGSLKKFHGCLALLYA